MIMCCVYVFTFTCYCHLRPNTGVSAFDEDRTEFNNKYKAISTENAGMYILPLVSLT